MTDTNKVAEHVRTALSDVAQLRPAEELAAYEQVLALLTELLNDSDDHGPGTA